MPSHGTSLANLPDLAPPEDRAMNILFSAEPGYFQHLAVAAASVAENSRAPIAFHVLTCDCDAAAEAKLHNGLRRYRHTTLTFHRVDAALIDGFFVDRYLTRECYLRLLAADLLPEEIGRIIYLDCDVVAVDDLRPLWMEDLEGKLVAAAPDYPRIPLTLSRDRLSSLGIPPGAPYVNSGVLLMDLDGWRREGASARLADFIRRRGADLPLHDQDAINAVLCGDIKLLDCRWNLQARMYLVGRKSLPEDYDATRRARRHPAIIHYTGSEKPWLFRSRIARKGDYRRFLRRTPWRNARPPLTGFAQHAEYRLDRLLSRAGIDYLQWLYYAQRLPRKLGLIRQPPAGAKRMTQP